MELRHLTKITHVSIYGPIEDRPKYYKNIKQKILDFRNENVIICCGWNVVLNPDVDPENYQHINNPRARSEVLKLIDKDNYIDVFRFLHDDKGLTWNQINPLIVLVK